tara:strand:- start:4416 stop:4532 length:117 start_codon:yes stop_codon:yes gene_type:complete
MGKCEKCGELTEWFRECGWVHVYDTECLEFRLNEKVVE